MPSIFLQCGQQNTRLIEKKPRLTRMSFFNGASQYGQIGSTARLSILSIGPPGKNDAGLSILQLAR
jgi:hypothetical protein